MTRKAFSMESQLSLLHYAFSHILLQFIIIRRSLQYI